MTRIGAQWRPDKSKIRDGLLHTRWQDVRSADRPRDQS